MTNRNGIKPLATWPVDSRACHYSQDPLEIDKRGRLTALELGATPTPSGECDIDLSRTHLLRYRADGTSETLWLPDRFARWLARGDVAVSGDLLAVSALQSGRIALIDQRRHTTRIISAGLDFGHFSFAGPRSLLVQYGHDLATSVRRFSTTGKPGNWVYTGGGGKDADVTACGNYAAVATNHHLQIRDAHGRIIYRRGVSGKRYGRPVVTCSGEYLDYVMLTACCESGDSPPVKRVGDLLDLSLLHRNFIRHGS
jgi:hypothetical protein